MNVLSIKEMVQREEEAFYSGISAAALMEAAGEAMAHCIVHLYPGRRRFVVLVGKGNNGGDGLVVARHLAAAGKPPQIVLSAPEDRLGELPKTCLDRLRRQVPNIEVVSWNSDFRFPGGDGVVIDGLLGIQARGALRGHIAEIVARLNSARARQFFRTVALDLPTGLAAYEEGPAPGDGNAAAQADVTIAVGYAKRVLCREALAGWVGRLEVVPWGGTESISTARQILVGPELATLLPRRNALSHKGDFGRLTIVGGSPGFTGAPVLAAQAALAMGAGLLSITTHAEAAPLVAAHAPPEAMVSGWGETTPEVVRNATAIVIGPGLGANAETLEMLRAVLAVGCPVVIDADGLNVLAKNLNLLDEARGPLLLTPHPGEMTRLLGYKFTPDERESVAREWTDKHRITLLLKGTRTLVTERGQPLFINTTGNPGLSSGGSGDTLSGLLGALLAQGLRPLDAARLGAWLHGRAADIVLSERGCEEGMTATMLSAHLGAALVSLRAEASSKPGLLERAKTQPEPEEAD